MLKKQANISLDDNQLFSDQKYLDGLKPVYAGGFRYLPALQNPTGSTTLVYRFYFWIYFKYYKRGFKRNSY